MANPFDQFDSGNPFDQFDTPTHPMKIGQAGFGDALRETLAGTDWATKNIAGAGTALSDLYQGAKQLFGQGDQQAIEANNIIKKSAPVGTFVGNAALSAIPFGAAKTVGQAALVGGGMGLLNPVEGDQSAGNIAKGKLADTILGAVSGAGGQYLGDKLGAAIAAKLQAKQVAQSANQPIDATLQAAQQMGLVVPPTSVNPTWLNQLKEGIAGKIATAQTASNKNAAVIDDAAKSAVGLGAADQLTSEAMQNIRKQAYQAGYEPIAKLGMMPTDQTYLDAVQAIANKYKGVANSFPGAAPDTVEKLAQPFLVGQFDAGNALQASQFLRDQATAAFRSGDTGTGQAAKQLAKALEDQIERNLSNTGADGQQILQGFRDARQLMAKAHTIEDAIVEGGGTINARKLAQRAQAGKPLSGDLETIANFANNFPKATQPTAQVAGPGVSKLNSFASLLTGGTGFATGGPVGAMLGAAAPFVIPPAMRARLLSQGVQQGLLDAKYSTPLLTGGNAFAQYLPVAGTVAGLQAFGQ